MHGKNSSRPTIYSFGLVVIAAYVHNLLDLLVGLHSDVTGVDIL